MKKILQIAIHEYRRQVVRKAFLGVLLLPLFIIAIMFVVMFVVVSTTIDSDRGVVGYVDPSNALARAQQPATGALNTYQRFDTAGQARQALEQKRIIAYYVLAPDFAASGQSEFAYWQNKPGRDVMRGFEQFALSALLAGQDPSIANRLAAGSVFVYVSLDESRRFDENNVLSFLLPIMVMILFIIALFSGASYLMQAVVDEKENRTIEIIVTSVTPMQLMAGKVTGLTAVGLTQIGAWLLGAGAALYLLRDRLPVIQGISLEPGLIALVLVLFVLQYLQHGAIMAAIGSTVIDVKQGQSYSTPFVMLAMAPLFFMGVIMFDPNGIIAVALSLFPLTSPMTLLLRYGMTTLPAWQVIVAVALLALSAVGAIWLAARIFRVGMLRFGQRMTLSEIAASIRI